MATSAEWVRGYVRQAQADFRMWQMIELQADVHPCHRLLLLQMAREKLCKARYAAEGAPISSLQTSHAYVAKRLPLVIRDQLLLMERDVKASAGLLIYTRRLANEIEVVNPAVDRNGQRPENCEYPWEDFGRVLHSPLDWSFIPLQLLQDRWGPTFVKLLQLSIERAVQEFQ